ncbi:hypothetical protein HPB47_009903 [Ixodes persulcatus]|uniref:Uncharacterized protein n=1 Tax=Ixodes persulcatus TaxID=34615 RepID=A0AC60P165_IXOPE|nr:hypothetical protein HPB47_009903 [Ixodes persulcatus]
MPETDEVKNSDELATAAAKMPENRRIEVVELSSPRIELGREGRDVAEQQAETAELAERPPTASRQDKRARERKKGHASAPPNLCRPLPMASQVPTITRAANDGHAACNAVLLRLKETVLDKSSPRPRIVVAVDIRKAFDGVPHDTVLTKARDLGLKGKIYNFIASFLENRSFQVQIGQETSSTHHNGVGVPQGSVIAPTLFNIAMSQLPARLAKIPNIEHAIYADDVSVWTHTGCLGKQEEALQAALDTIHAYSIEVGLATAPDKTEFVVVHGGRHTKAKEADKDNISLSIGEQPITRKVSIRLLGMFIDEKCTANSWYNRTVATTKQLQALERLNHEARRITTGLPRYTPLAALKSCSGINDLTELLETHVHTQEVRLQSTHAGRHTLAMLGHDITNLPDLPQLSPP